jgi:hypothetical protein
MGKFLPGTNCGNLLAGYLPNFFVLGPAAPES